MADQYTNPGATFEKAPHNMGPAYHEDRFQPIGGRMPVALRTTPRPKTYQPNVPSLSPRRMTVLVRDANSRPNEAGILGNNTFVSNPTLSGLGVEDPAEAIAAAVPKPSTILMVVGAFAALYYLGFKR